MKSVKHFVPGFIAWIQAHPWRSGSLAVAVFILLYFVFFNGAKAQYETMVVAPQDFMASVSVAGTVVAAEEVDLGFAKSGRIASVSARAGKYVSRGTTLASIENGDARAAVAQRQAALESARARYASVAAGTRAEEVAVAQADVISAQEVLADAILDAYRAADDAVRNKTGDLFEHPRTSPEFIFDTSNSRYNEPSERGRKSLEDALVLWEQSLRTITPATAEAAIALGRTNLAAAASFLATLNQALTAAAPNQVVVTPAQMTIYIEDIAAARAAIAASQSSINSAAAALVAAQKNLALKKAGAVPQDIAIEAANVKAAQADVAAAQAELQKTLIVAPFSGIVSSVEAKVGAIASQNEPVISMLSEGSFQIEAYVPEIQIASLQVGDKATTTLDAYGPSEYFYATVVAIDPAETLKGGVSNYKTTLQFNEPDERIRSGLTANVVITTSIKYGVIAIPQAAVVLRGSARLVKVQEGDAIVERAVVLGATSMLGNVEIVSGLSSGDTIVLNPGT